MTASPLQFAKDFARLQSQFSSLQTGDQQLLLLVDFWPSLREHRGDSAYQSYFDEYKPLLRSLINGDSLADLTIEELDRLRNTLLELEDDQALEFVTTELAKLHFYVGAFEQGLALCCTLTEQGAPSFTVGSLDLNDVDTTNEFVVFQSICELLSTPDITTDTKPSPPTPLPEGEGSNGVLGSVSHAAHDDVSSPRRRRSSDETSLSSQRKLGSSQAPRGLDLLLGEILADWQDEREGIYHDRAKCLFVEKNDHGKATRGRLRTLVGKVELFGKSAPTDEITFDNQIKTPDDPFIGVAYDSLKAVRRTFKTLGFRSQSASFYHAHFSIENSKQTFTGDSIGIAVGLLTYTQLLRPEIMRLDRFLSSEVAYTGGVDADGKVTPVNEETLALKITRAFFSPIKYLVLPEANFDSARKHLDWLRAKYPRRHLILVPVERLADIIDDHNVVRSEKICIGEFVVKRAYKYTRATKIQVPLLLVLAYLLLCLIYPKAWVGFDWNPRHLIVSGKTITAVNAVGGFLWEYQFKDTVLALPDSWQVANINSDNKNEVLIVPFARGISEQGSRLWVFDHHGDTAFTRYCPVSGEIPFGSSTPQRPVPVEGGFVHVESYHGKPLIIASINTSSEDSYIHFWNGDGTQIGSYTNPGYSQQVAYGDFDGVGSEVALFDGTNNPFSCRTLFLLNPQTAAGEAPPYVDENNPSNQGAVKGTQRIVVYLHPSKVLRAAGIADYQSGGQWRQITDSLYGLDVNEGDGCKPLCVQYIFDRRLRVLRVSCSDAYVTELRRLRDRGEVSPEYAISYEDSILAGVTYFIDGKFLTQSWHSQAFK